MNVAAKTLLGKSILVYHYLMIELWKKIKMNLVV